MNDVAEKSEFGKKSHKKVHIVADFSMRASVLVCLCVSVCDGCLFALFPIYGIELFTVNGSNRKCSTAQRECYFCEWISLSCRSVGRRNRLQCCCKMNACKSKGLHSIRMENIPHRMKWKWGKYVCLCVFYYVHKVNCGKRMTRENGGGIYVNPFSCIIIVYISICSERKRRNENRYSLMLANIIRWYDIVAKTTNLWSNSPPFTFGQNQNGLVMVS